MPSTISLPERTELTFDNGLTVVVVPRDQVPLVSLSLRFPGGGSLVAANEAGLAMVLALIMVGLLMPAAVHAAPTPSAADESEYGNCSDYHVVRRGETLSQIAERYGVSIRELMQANMLRNPNHIYAGQKLCIPGEMMPGQLGPIRRVG